MWILPFVISAQHSIQSKVINSQNGELVEMATVRLLSLKDSSLISGAQTNANGYFKLDKVRNGKYTLVVSSIGYNTYTHQVEMSGKDIVLKSIQLSEIVQSLGEVEVRGTAAQMVVRGDTTEYNAAAFKTSENAVVEELLKKMPGVEIDADGKITVNGEEVKKVRVDGKKFFGDDAQMATKNIPAEMIDKVQVIDDKSDMAKLTGFEDDETERIINLTLKPNRKRGFFGIFTGAGGMDLVKGNDDKYDPRYNGNVFMNIMRGESQTAIIGGANNTNEMRSGRGRSNMSGGSGITNTQNIGINNNTEINKKLKVGANVSANHSNNLTLTESHKESYSNEKNFDNYDDKSSQSNNYDVSARLELEWNIDTLNTIIFQPNLSYTNAYSLSTNTYTYFTESDTTSYGDSYNESKSQTISGGLRVIYNHKFMKPGRTFTTNANVTINNTESDGWNNSEKNVASTNEQTIIDQKTDNTSNSYNYNIRVSYVEPLYKNRHFLELASSFTNNNRNSEKDQYNLDDSGNYTVFDSVYSNNFKNRFFSETLEANYRFKDKAYDLMLGIRANPSQTYSYTIYGNDSVRNITNEVWNFAPTASFKYRFGKKEYARIEYRGTTKQPSVSQMEPAKNNSNPMNETVGNPGLNPAFEQSLRLMYSKFNAERFSSFSVGLNGKITKDALVSNSIYDATGKQYRQTVNASDVPYSINANIMYNTPIIQKRLHFNTRTTASYNQRIGYTLKDMDAEIIDVDNLLLGDLSKTGNTQVGENLSLTFTHDVVEIGLRANASYSYTTNNLSTESATNVWNWTANGNLTFHLPYQFTISSDIGYTARYGYSTVSSDLNELIWNASIDKVFLKNQGTLSIKAYDILNQRKNIREVIGDNYVRYDTYNTLPTYIMLSFSYKLNKMGSNKMKGPHGEDMDKMPARGDMPRGGGNMPPAGPPPQM